jgi:hypothetical protein
LERVALLLQELLIASRKVSLLRLLLKRTSANLGLCALQGSSLSASAKTSQLLTSLLESLTIGLLCGQLNTLLLLGHALRLLEPLLIQGSNSLRCS